MRVVRQQAGGGHRDVDSVAVHGHHGGAVGLHAVERDRSQGGHGAAVRGLSGARSHERDQCCSAEGDAGHLGGGAHA